MCILSEIVCWEPALHGSGSSKAIKGAPSCGCFMLFKPHSHQPSCSPSQSHCQPCHPQCCGLAWPSQDHRLPRRHPKNLPRCLLLSSQEKEESFKTGRGLPDLSNFYMPPLWTLNQEGQGSGLPTGSFSCPGLHSITWSSLDHISTTAQSLLINHCDPGMDNLTLLKLC